MIRPRSLLIVDDHPLMREGLKTILRRFPDLQVTGEAGSHREALAKARRLLPDGYIVDISLPDKDGIQLTRDLLKINPKAAIVVISVHCKADFVVEAFKAGALGFVAKDAPAERIVEAVRTALKGEYYLDGSASQAVISRLTDGCGDRSSIRDQLYSRLTPREQQVLRLLAEGRSAKQIASELSISLKTVENHRAKIMGKLRLDNLVELVRYAARIGLVDVDSWTG